MLFLLMSSKKGSSTSSMATLQTKLLIAVPLLQVCFMYYHWSCYYTHRHRITAANRVLRIAGLFRLAVGAGFAVLSKILPADTPDAWILAAYCFLCPIFSLQASANYLLPASWSLLVQPLSVVTAAAFSWEGPRAVQQSEGVHTLAVAVCSKLDVAAHLLLYGASWGAIPADTITLALSQNTPHATCSSGTAFGQLILYVNFMLSFLLPLHGSYMAELQHKVVYHRRRGFQVTVAGSMLLPLPQNPLLSHAVLLLCGGVILWFVAEMVAPWMAVR